MGQLRGGTTIAGYPVLHSGLTAANLTGSLTLGGNLYLPSGFEIHSKYNNAYIIKDHSNGHVTLSAAGGTLFLGYSNTVAVRLDANLVGNDGSTKIADTAAKLYYQGNDTDGRYLKLAGGTAMTGTLVSRSVTGAIAQSGGSLGALEVMGTSGAGNAAFMSFHRPGVYAAYFGLDTDNQWKVGGWSAGAVAYKIWHEGNDGSGSGLDADTVDGIDSTRMPYGDNGTGSTNVTDMNSIWKSGFYEGNDIANAPTTGWYWVVNAAHKSNSTTYKYNGQIAFQNNSSGTPEAYIRSTAANITSTSWGRLWHDKNFTPGNYLPLAGGTMTGAIIYGGAFSTGTKVLGLGQGYDWYSDNTGAGTANNRVWLDAPNSGEVVIGPRSGANYLYQVRLRALTIAMEGTNATMNGNEVWHRGNLAVGTTAPANPPTGAIWIDTN